MPAASTIGIVSSAKGGTISGYESRSSPYPSAKVFLSRFGTVSDRSYPEAVSRLSQLSFSSWAICAHRRMVSAIRSPALPQTNSLPGLTLNEPSCSAGRKLRSGPRRWISRAMTASLALTDPARRWRVCPGRPFSKRGSADGTPAQKTHGIELQDYSEESGLRCRASLALDEHISVQSSATSLERGG